MTKPFSPAEAKANKIHHIPDEVFEVVNNLLFKNYNDSSITILQDQVVTEICKRMDISRQLIFDNKWLDFEDVYRKQSWDVDYNKRLYYEDGSDFWVFKPKT